MANFSELLKLRRAVRSLGVKKVVRGNNTMSVLRKGQTPFVQIARDADSSHLQQMLPRLHQHAVLRGFSAKLDRLIEFRVSDKLTGLGGKMKAAGEQLKAFANTPERVTAATEKVKGAVAHAQGAVEQAKGVAAAAQAHVPADVQEKVAKAIKNRKKKGLTEGQQWAIGGGLGAAGLGAGYMALRPQS